MPATICRLSTTSCGSLVQVPLGSPVEPDVSFRTAMPEVLTDIDISNGELQTVRRGRAPTCEVVIRRRRCHEAGDAEALAQLPDLRVGGSDVYRQDGEVERSRGQPERDDVGTVADREHQELAGAQAAGAKQLAVPEMRLPDVVGASRVGGARLMDQQPLRVGLAKP